MVDCQFSAFIKNPANMYIKEPHLVQTDLMCLSTVLPWIVGAAKTKEKCLWFFSGQNKISNNIIQCRGYNLGQNKWEIQTSLPPKIKDGKMGCYGFCVASSLIWGRWEGGLLFRFILSKTVVSKKIESIMYMYVQAPYPDTVSHLLILNISAFWSQKNKNLTTIMNILLLAISLFSWNPSSSHTWGCRQQCCNKGLEGNKQRWTMYSGIFCS